MKSKSYVFMFITSLFVFTSSLSAATIDSNAHKQTVTNRHISRRIYNYIKLKKTTSGRLF